MSRFARSVSRPPIASEWLTELDDGRLGCELCHRWRGGTTHVLLEPEEVIERLAVLVPRPRVQQVVDHRVLASAAPQRPEVVLAATSPHAGCVCTGRAQGPGAGETTRAILECLGLPSRAPPVAPARLDGSDAAKFGRAWAEPG